MDIHAAAFFVVIVRVVRIRSELRKGADQFEALTQRIAHAVIKYVVVVVGIGKDASHHGFHNVAGGSFHDNIACEVGRQCPRLAQHGFKFGQFLVVGEYAHNQKVSNFLKAEFVSEIFNQLVDPVPAIPKFAVAGLFLTINIFFRDYLGNVRKSRKDSFAIFVAQSAFHAVFFIKRGIDIVVTL